MAVNNNMSAIKIIDIRNVDSLIWGNNCNVYKLINEKQFYVIQETISPGSKDKMHYHSISDQFLYLLSGKIEVKLIDSEISLKQYQGVMIPSKCVHCVVNSEGNEVAILLTISVPGKVDDRVLVAD